jgi:hypothetical protein
MDPKQATIYMQSGDLVYSLKSIMPDHVIADDLVSMKAKRAMEIN